MKRKTKLKGSSLIEVLVSLVIISMVITLAMGTYFRITKASSTRSLKKMNQLEEIAQKAINEKNLGDQTYILHDGSIAFQRVEPFQNDTFLYQYELKTNKNEKGEVLTFYKIILNSHE